MTYLTEAERAAIDRAYAAEYGETPYAPEAAAMPSQATISKVLAKHNAAARQRQADERALGRSLPAYPDELGDLALLKLAQMQVAPDLTAPHGEPVAINFDGWDKRTREQAQAERKMIERAFAADEIEAEADRIRARVVRDESGEIVSVNQGIRVPEPR